MSLHIPLKYYQLVSTALIRDSYSLDGNIKGRLETGSVVEVRETHELSDGTIRLRVSTNSWITERLLSGVIIALQIDKMCLNAQTECVSQCKIIVDPHSIIKSLVHRMHAEPHTVELQNLLDRYLAAARTEEISKRKVHAEHVRRYPTHIIFLHDRCFTDWLSQRHSICASQITRRLTRMQSTLIQKLQNTGVFCVRESSKTKWIVDRFSEGITFNGNTSPQLNTLYSLIVLQGRSQYFTGEKYETICARLRENTMIDVCIGLGAKSIHAYMSNTTRTELNFDLSLAAPLSISSVNVGVSVDGGTLTSEHVEQSLSNTYTPVHRWWFNLPSFIDMEIQMLRELEEKEGGEPAACYRIALAQRNYQFQKFAQDRLVSGKASSVTYIKYRSESHRSAKVSLAVAGVGLSGGGNQKFVDEYTKTYKVQFYSTTDLGIIPNMFVKNTIIDTWTKEYISPNTFRIVSVRMPTLKLNISLGYLTCSAVPDTYWDAMWVALTTDHDKYVILANRFKTSTKTKPCAINIHAYPTVAAGCVRTHWRDAHWYLEPINGDGKIFRICNRHNPAYYIQYDYYKKKFC